MTRISSNSFSRDSIGLRQTRLALIEHNATTIAELLGNTTPEIQTWIGNCYSGYDALVLAADAKRNEAEGKTQASDAALGNLRTELSACKQYITSFYADDPEHQLEYGIAGDLPNKAEAILRAAKNVRDTAEAHTTAQIAHSLPADRQTLLAGHISAYSSAMEEHADIKSAQKTSKAAERSRFGADSKMLRKLLSLWLNRMNKSDERIAMLGMIIPTNSGRRGLAGIPTLALNITVDALIITPDSTRPEATSYQSQYRVADSNAEWADLANNNAVEIPLNDSRLGSGIAYEFRIRARNAHGLGEWSQIFRAPAQA